MRPSRAAAVIACLGVMPVACRSQAPTPVEVEPAVVAGQSFLEALVARDAYKLECRASDGSQCPIDRAGHVFAASFIVEALGPSPEPAVANDLGKAILLEQRGQAWGYAAQAPIDVDDTAFALRALRRLGLKDAAAPVFVFYSQAGGFATFLGGAGAKLTTEPSEANNLELHPEVNANVYSLLTGTALASYVDLDRLLPAQAADGSWGSYFYPGQAYGTWMVLRALCGSAKLSEPQSAARDRGVAYLVQSQASDGSWGALGMSGDAYDTALSVVALEGCGAAPQAVRRGRDWLRRAQAEDGSWSYPGAIWVYRAKDAPRVDWTAYDSARSVTTSLAVWALAGVTASTDGRIGYSAMHP